MTGPLRVCDVFLHSLTTKMSHELPTLLDRVIEPTSGSSRFWGIFGFVHPPIDWNMAIPAWGNIVPRTLPPVLIHRTQTCFSQHEVKPHQGSIGVLQPQNGVQRPPRCLEMLPWSSTGVMSFLPEDLTHNSLPTGPQTHGGHWSHVLHQTC